MEKIFKKNEDYYEIKNKVQEKIFNSDSGVDNKILKEIYDIALEKGNNKLANQIHQSMYENRATSRIKSAERISSSLGEWFDRDKFEEKIRSEGDFVERPLVLDKSEAFKGKPYFSVGAYASDINKNEDAKSEYLNRVDIMIKDMSLQLQFSENMERRMSETLSEINKYFGEDLYAKIQKEKEPEVKDVSELDLHGVEKNYFNVKIEIEQKILSPESNVDNNVLENIYNKALELNNNELAIEIKDVIYENSASQRIKLAERVQNLTNQSFDRSAFEEAIKKYGDVIERPVESERSAALKDSPHFSPGMKNIFVGVDYDQTKIYCDKVSTLTNDLSIQLDIAKMKENRTISVISKIKDFFGEDMYEKLKFGKKISNKLSEIINDEPSKKHNLSMKRKIS